MLGIRPLLATAAGALTSPLTPDDYRATLNPLWSRNRPSGRVKAVVPETADAATVLISPGLGWRRGIAGQHVDTAFRIDGVWHSRTFSLSSPPDRADGLISITVKANPDGLVSRHIVQALRPGDIVRLGQPAGTFVLPAELPERLLFVTAGSGITPVMAMLRHLAAGPRMPDVVLAHSAPDPSKVIFGAELRRLAARFPSLRLHEQHTRPAGDQRSTRLTMAALATLCPDLPARMAWVCGPAALVEQAESYWRERGISERLLTERFHPNLRAGNGAGGRVRFVRSGRETTTSADTPLLMAGERSGMLMPSGCRMGICHRCLVPLADGRVRDLRTGVEHGTAGDLIQTCVSAAVGDIEIDL
ncbi:ferredoxin reductase [Frankia sp. AgB32]|uniref:ferredoxin reductase n=1 Tax=Frankia sp. AgB32 TaxID=631119 RepID=UPI00200FF6FF|nr:ferredoxin reductase [Frankia sp. AgB32]MCK9894940.1 ferredoxin reductase [Frankia sp. AgB32]